MGPISNILEMPSSRIALIGLRTDYRDPLQVVLLKNGTKWYVFDFVFSVLSNFCILKTEMWRYIMDSQLSINTADHSILVTEPVLNPKANREKTGQIMFESLHFPNFFLSQQDVLALFASGRTTGVSLCCGHDQMWSTPIYEGYCEPHAVLRSGFGGRQLTQYMMDSSDQSLSEKVARDMKEKLCYIALDSEKVSTEKRMYKMPDGKDIEMNHKVLSQCGEALFSPQIIGIEHEGLGHMVYNSVMKTSVSIRRDLFSNLVVHGGTSLIQGMEQRLQKEVESPNAYNTRMINVIAPPERKYSSWIGGSILGSLSTFQEMWITKQEYQESGPSIIHRKAL